MSRDLLEYSKNIELIYYIARQSVVSAVSASIPVCESEIRLDSAFQKEQVFNDFNKLTFTLLRHKKSQYMLIDLVDERFQLAKYKGSYVTYSLECQKSGLLPEHVSFARKESVCLNSGEISYKIDGKNLDEFLDKFCDKLMTLYSAKQIILHRVYGAECYIDDSGEVHPFDQNTVGRVKHDNYLYEYMYEYIHNKFQRKTCNIDISRGYYAYQKHKWGLSPIHFQKEYYQKVLSEINSYIGLQLEDSNL